MALLIDSLAHVKISSFFNLNQNSPDGLPEGEGQPRRPRPRRPPIGRPLRSRPQRSRSPDLPPGILVMRRSRAGDDAQEIARRWLGAGAGGGGAGGRDSTRRRTKGVMGSLKVQVLTVVVLERFCFR